MNENERNEIVNLMGGLEDRIVQHKHMLWVLYGYDNYFFRDDALQAQYEALREAIEKSIEADVNEYDRLETAMQSAEMSA